MTPFNLQEFQKNPSRKVVTRDGRLVKILYTNARREYSIIALVEREVGKDYLFSFLPDGTMYGDRESVNDLFFATETKVGWLNIYPEDDICDTKEEALRCRANVPNARTIKITWEE